MHQQPTLLSRSEAAAVLRLTVQAFGRLVKAGKGPIITAVGRRRYVRLHHMQEFLDANALPRPLRRPPAGAGGADRPRRTKGPKARAPADASF